MEKRCCAVFGGRWSGWVVRGWIAPVTGPMSILEGAWVGVAKGLVWAQRLENVPWVAEAQGRTVGKGRTLPRGLQRVWAHTHPYGGETKGRPQIRKKVVQS